MRLSTIFCYTCELTSTISISFIFSTENSDRINDNGTSKLSSNFLPTVYFALLFNFLSINMLIAKTVWYQVFSKRRYKSIETSEKKTWNIFRRWQRLTFSDVAVFLSVSRSHATQKKKCISLSFNQYQNQHQSLGILRIRLVYFFFHLQRNSSVCSPVYRAKSKAMYRYHINISHLICAKRLKMTKISITCWTYETHHNGESLSPTIRGFFIIFVFRKKKTNKFLFMNGVHLASKCDCCICIDGIFKHLTIKCGCSYANSSGQRSRLYRTKNVFPVQ